MALKVDYEPKRSGKDFRRVQSDHGECTRDSELSDHVECYSRWNERNPTCKRYSEAESYKFTDRTLPRQGFCCCKISL